MQNTCLTDFLEVTGVAYPALSQEYHPRPPEVFRRYINKEIIRRSEDQQRQCAVSLEASSLATVALTTSILSAEPLPVLGKVIADESPAVCKNSSPSFQRTPGSVITIQRGGAWKERHKDYFADRWSCLDIEPASRSARLAAEG